MSPVLRMANRPVLRRSIAAALVLAFAAAARAERGRSPAAPWDGADMSAPLTVTPAPAELAEKGLNAGFVASVPYRGRPTSFFAYWGLPAGAKPGDRVPGIVLVHGGGATALADWVRLWNSRGYAAISMDNVSRMPTVGGRKSERPSWGPDFDRHGGSGPDGWGASFDGVDAPIADQWTYHAVAAVIRSRRFLASLPEVDGAKIGLTGVSWGGYLACIAGSVDPEFRFAVPVYGCGFLGDHSAWRAELVARGERGRRWLDLWDPSVYLAKAAIPFLWVDGTSDRHYPVDSLARSAALVGDSSFVTIKNMIHAHGAPSENPPEILAFADHVLGRDGGGGWVRFSNIRAAGGGLSLDCELGGRAVDRAELVWTSDANLVWDKRVWRERTLTEWDPKSGHLECALPDGVRAFTLNLVKDGEMTYSTGPVIVGEACLDRAEPHARVVVDRILANVAKLRAADTNAVPMAFWDFDGTILRGDVTEGLAEDGVVRYQGMAERAIETGLSGVYPREGGVEAFRRDYARFCEIGSWFAYPWAAQMLRGSAGAEAEKLAADAFRSEYRGWYFSSSLAMMAALERAGVENYVISASPELFVRGAAETLGLPVARFRGIRVKSAGGRITGEVLPPVPTGDGKVDVLRELVAARGHGAAVAAFGNSYGTDGPFLRYVATQTSLAGGAKGTALMINGGRKRAGWSEHFICVDQAATVGP